MLHLMQRPLQGFKPRGALVIDRESWTLCSESGVQENPGIQDFQVSQSSPLHQGFFFPSQHSDVAWPAWMGCVVVNLLWSSATLMIKDEACSSALSALLLQEIKASFFATNCFLYFFTLRFLTAFNHSQLFYFFQRISFA